MKDRASIREYLTANWLRDGIYVDLRDVHSHGGMTIIVERDGVPPKSQFIAANEIESLTPEALDAILNRLSSN